MDRSTLKSRYVMGFRDGLPFVLVVVPFGLLFGVVAVEAGLTTLQTLVFTSVVFAGASQFAALQLMLDNAPLLVIVATALTVNLRMAMYSASLATYIGKAPFWTRAVAAYLTVDQSYACSINRFEEFPDWSVAERLRYFFGSITPVAPAWFAATGLGIWLGDGVPEWMALDFALPICFLAIIAPMLRTLAHVAAALTSIIAALVFSGLPLNLGLLCAALLAMIVGAQVELWQARRAPR